MDEEKKYFNYGGNQIELQATLTAMADNVLNYVNSQSWSSKRKLKFLNAYSDIISKGITGANNTSGQWAIDLSQDLDISLLPLKDQEMYHEAAYYILQQMKGIPTKTSEEETKKENLQLYDNKTHQGNFNAFISNKMFGDRDWSVAEDWNILDDRDETTGLRGTNNRALKLAEMLEGYSKSLEDNKYNFEGTAFTDLNDLKGRIANAVTALKDGTWNLNDVDALNQIGLNWKDYFNDGSGDIAGTDADGNEITYALLAEANNLKIKAEAKAKAAKQALLAKENSGVLNIKGGINANEALNRPNEYAEYLGRTYGVGNEGFNAINVLILNLLEKAYTLGLDSNEKRKLGNFIHYIRTNNPNYQNYNLSLEDETELLVHLNMKGKRLQDFIRLPWQTSDGRYTYADKSGNIYFLKPRNLKLLLQKPFTRSAAYNNYKNNFLINTSSGKDLRRAKIDQRVVGDDFKTEDYLRMGAIAQDIAGTVAAFAPVYGTAASGILGLTSLGTNMAADIADESVSGLDVAKNAAINLGLGVVGLVPGLGGAAKSGKWLTQIAKWVPRILTLAQAGNIAINDDVKNSLAKATDTSKWNTITNHDLKNISYALSTVAGLSRGARGIYNERKFGPAFKGSSKTELKITTESGKKVTVTDEQLKELNKIGRKSGNDAANKYLNEKIIGDASGTEKVNVTFKTGKTSRLTSPTVKAETITSSTSIPHRTQAYRRALSIQNQRAKSGKGIYKFAPRFLNTDYEIYQKAYNISTPLIGLIDKIKLAWNPITKGKFKETNSNASTPSTGPTTNTSSQLQNQGINIPAGRFDDRGIAREELLNRAIINRYKNILSGNVSNNPVKEGKFKFDNINVEVNKAPTGTYDIFINGKRTDSIKDLTSTELKKHIASLVKEHRSSVNRGKSKSEKVSVKEMGKILLDLKRMGWLKQGGQINNFDLDKTISEFLKKLK